MKLIEEKDGKLVLNFLTKDLEKYIVNPQNNVSLDYIAGSFIGLIENKYFSEDFIELLGMQGTNVIFIALSEIEYSNCIFLAFLRLNSNDGALVSEVQYPHGNTHKLDFPEFIIKIDNLEFTIRETLIDDRYYYFTLHIL